MHVNNDTRLITLDFETLGTDPSNCTILALGIVIGDIFGNIIFKEEFIFPLVEQLNEFYPKKVEKGTISFWNKEKNKRQFNLYLQKCFSETKSIIDIMTNIEEHLITFTEGKNNNYLFIGNAPEFVLGLLKRLYKYIKKDVPFNYKQIFDFRSARYLTELANILIVNFDNDSRNNALSDAEYEYKTLVNYIKQIYKGSTDNIYNDDVSF